MVFNVFLSKIEDLTSAGIKAFMFIYLLFEDVKHLLISVLVLITIDQITGVWRACKKREFKWKIFNKVYAKMILYMIALIAVFIYEHFIIGVTSHYFTKGLATIIGFQELSSTYLNISKITGTNILGDYVNKLRRR